MSVPAEKTPVGSASEQKPFRTYVSCSPVMVGWEARLEKVGAWDGDVGGKALDELCGSRGVPHRYRGAG